VGGGDGRGGCEAGKGGGRGGGGGCLDARLGEGGGCYGRGEKYYVVILC
jgi:hypothetical protein